MMNYLIEFETRARQEFLELPRETAAQLAAVMADLSADPRPLGAKRLPGAEGYRIRRGELRLLYSVDDEKKVLRVFRAGRRREVYSKVREKLFQIWKGGKTATAP